MLPNSSNFAGLQEQKTINPSFTIFFAANNHDNCRFGIATPKKLIKLAADQLPKLKDLDEEIEGLAKKNDLSEEDIKTLESKRKTYEENLEKAKKKTIENIQYQLKENGLTAADLNDNRN
nr:1257_t:CDS:2 [Entrophospora candida]